MSRSVFLVVCTFILTIACKELFSPDVQNRKLPLVVDGLITDEAKPYSIRLTKAGRYDNTESYEYKFTAVSGAKVTVSDDCGHIYQFSERDSGVYLSDPAEFVGVPGRSYTLFIKTMDNQEYRSAPQILLPNVLNVKAESEFGTQVQLIDNGTGELVAKAVEGVNIYYTIESLEDTMTRFRFEHKVYKEYIELPNKKSCWALVLPYNGLINITDKYNTTINNIEKHNVCFVQYIENETWVEEGVDNLRIFNTQIAKIVQYRINPETYQYYKNINVILAASGKIFEPAPFQVKGNVTCISDNTSDVLGFFEASSISVSYYALYNGSSKIRYINSYEPPSEGGCFLEGPLPDWWVY